MRSYICVAFLLVALFFQVAVCAQDMERVVAWLPPPGKFIGPVVLRPDRTSIPTEEMAVEILEVLVGAKPIIIGEPFLAGEDWMRGLRIRMKNISDNALSGVREDFRLPEAKMMSSLEYGTGAGMGTGAREQRVIMPGEEFELIRTEEAYEHNRKRMAEKSGITNITRVQLGLAWVKFADGTTWVGQPRVRRPQAVR